MKTNSRGEVPAIINIHEDRIWLVKCMDATSLQIGEKCARGLDIEVPRLMLKGLSV